MKYKVILSLVVLIVLTLIIGFSYKPNQHSSMLDNADLLELEHLEQFVSKNEPCQHDIESFQILPDKEIIKNNWTKVQSNLDEADAAYGEAKDIAIVQNARMLEDKRDIDAAVNRILTGDAKTNSIGAFANLRQQQITGNRILNEITTDLDALYKEAGFATGNPDLKVILGEEEKKAQDEINRQYGFE